MFAALYQLNPAEVGGTEWNPEYFGQRTSGATERETTARPTRPAGRNSFNIASWR